MGDGKLADLPSPISHLLSRPSLQSDSVSANFWTMFHAIAIALLCIGLLMQTDIAAQMDPEAEDLGALRQEIEKLRTGQQRLQKELDQIKGLLTKARRPPAPSKIQPTAIDIGGEPFKGKKDARVTIVDFTDYQ